MNSMSPPFAP